MNKLQKSYQNKNELEDKDYNPYFDQYPERVSTNAPKKKTNIYKQINGEKEKKKRLPLAYNSAKFYIFNHFISSLT